MGYVLYGILYQEDKEYSMMVVSWRVILDVLVIPSYTNIMYGMVVPRVLKREMGDLSRIRWKRTNIIYGIVVPRR